MAVGIRCKAVRIRCKPTTRQQHDCLPACLCTPIKQGILKIWMHGNKAKIMNAWYVRTRFNMHLSMILNRSSNLDITIRQAFTSNQIRLKLIQRKIALRWSVSQVGTRMSLAPEARKQACPRLFRRKLDIRPYSKHANHHARYEPRFCTSLVQAASI